MPEGQRPQDHLEIKLIDQMGVFALRIVRFIQSQGSILTYKVKINYL